MKEAEIKAAKAVATIETTKETRRELIGETLLDIGKLVFGGAVLATVLESGVNRLILGLSSFVVCLVLMLMGVWILTDKKNKK